MRKNWFFLIILTVASFLSACSSVPRGNEQAGTGNGRIERFVPAPEASVVQQSRTEALAAERGVLLQQAQQELLVYHEIVVASDLVARAAVLRNKVTDYAFCRHIPADLTRVKHYATYGAFVDNYYRGRCVFHVERLAEELKYKNRREEVLPKTKKK